MKNESKILLIIPAYNEEPNILDTISKIDGRYDYIVINDGSTDNSKKVLEENNINHVNLIYNLGIGGAVQTGYKYAYQNGYDIAIQVDCDGQHDVNYVENIIEPIINEDYHFVIGSRFIKSKESSFQSTWLRRFGKNIISLCIKLISGVKVTDPTSGFRAANKDVIKLFASNYPTEYPEPESTLFLLKNNYKVKEVPVEMLERTKGSSSIGSWKDAYYMISVVLALFISNRRMR